MIQRPGARANGLDAKEPIAALIAVHNITDPEGFGAAVGPAIGLTQATAATA
jgi:hypothetical protein